MMFVCPFPQPCRGERGPTYQPDRDCKACWGAAYHPAVRRRLAGLPPAAPPRMRDAGPIPRPPCVHLGAPTGKTVTCSGCKGRVELKILGCAVHGTCTPGKPTPGVANCGTCGEYQRPMGPAPLSRHRIAPDQLGDAPGSKGAKFNGGPIRYRGRLAMAYRIGWAGSNVWLAELNDDYSVRSNVCLLGLYDNAAVHGREDPRLFIFRGRLHVSYHGVMGPRGPTNVLYARLTEDYRVEKVYYPHVPNRAAWEKSHSYFEGLDGELYMVYSVAPHRVFRVRGEHCELVGDTPNALPWSGGEKRGGASPIYHDGQYWHWFHGRLGPWSHGLYTLGVYTFAPVPPFQVLHGSPHPLLTGDHANRQAWQQPDFPASIWPAGAVLEDGLWQVGYGLQDHWCEVGEWSLPEVAACLRPAPLAPLPPDLRG